jgi:hypothetical protein
MSLMPVSGPVILTGFNFFRKPLVKILSEQLQMPYRLRNYATLRVCLALLVAGMGAMHPKLWWICLKENNRKTPTIPFSWD